MPLVTEAGFGLGAGYGRGALVVDGAVKTIIPQYLQIPGFN